MSMDPIELELLLTQLPGLLDRIEKLERAAADRADVDARRDSLSIQTEAKGGNFKHYLDPGASPDENDRLLAEEARNFVNGGGVLPEGFSHRIRAMMNDVERTLAGGAPLPPAEVK